MIRQKGVSGKTHSDPPAMNQFVFIFPYIARHLGKLASALAGLMVVSGASLVFPYVLKLMVDAVTVKQGSIIVNPVMVAVVAAVLLLVAVAGYASQVILQDLGFLLRNTLRRELFASLLYRPLRFHRRQRIGELSARAMEDVGRLQPLYANLVGPVFQHLMISIGCFALLLSISLPGTVVVVAVMLVPVPVILSTSRMIFNHFATGTAFHARSNALLEEMLTAIREVKVFSREQHVLRRYRAYQDAAMASEHASSKRQAFVQQSIVLVLSGILLGIFIASAQGWLPRTWSAGDAIAFYLYAYTLMMSTVAIGKAYMQYHGMIGALCRVRELIEEEEAASVNGQIARERLTGDVEFRGVSFSYNDGSPVLKDVSFHIAHRSWYLITGVSGSGKSTIANLIVGLYFPTAGLINIDSIPLEDWDICSLRSRVGYVPQETMLFHGTLRENILLANPELGAEQLSELLRIACVDRFVHELPDGIDTLVGERGYTLSGGQKTRVAIARALALDPDILILDEANAMLEEDVETALWQNLYALRSERTTIIMTHHWERIPAVYEHHIIAPAPHSDP